MITQPNALISKPPQDDMERRQEDRPGLGDWLAFLKVFGVVAMISGIVATDMATVMMAILIEVMDEPELIVSCARFFYAAAIVGTSGALIVFATTTYGNRKPRD